MREARRREGRAREAGREGRPSEVAGNSANLTVSVSQVWWGHVSWALESDHMALTPSQTGCFVFGKFRLLAVLQSPCGYTRDWDPIVS